MPIICLLLCLNQEKVICKHSLHYLLIFLWIKWPLTDKDKTLNTSKHDPGISWFNQNECTQSQGEIPEAGRMSEDISNSKKPHVWVLSVDGSTHWLLGPQVVPCLAALLFFFQCPINSRIQRFWKAEKKKRSGRQISGWNSAIFSWHFFFPLKFTLFCLVI